LRFWVTRMRKRGKSRKSQPSIQAVSGVPGRAFDLSDVACKFRAVERQLAQRRAAGASKKVLVPGLAEVPEKGML